MGVYVLIVHRRFDLKLPVNGISVLIFLRRCDLKLPVNGISVLIVLKCGDLKLPVNGISQNNNDFGLVEQMIGEISIGIERLHW